MASHGAAKAYVVAEIEAAVDDASFVDQQDSSEAPLHEQQLVRT